MTREEAIKLLDKWGGLFPSEAYEAVSMAIEALEAVQKHEEVYEFCGDCKEYDHENHRCPRWNKVIKRTVEEFEKANHIIRCCRCIRWERDRHEPFYGCCNQHNSTTGAYDFCSYAEEG